MDGWTERIPKKKKKKKKNGYFPFKFVWKNMKCWKGGKGRGQGSNISPPPSLPLVYFIEEKGILAAIYSAKLREVKIRGTCLNRILYTITHMNL